MLLKALERFSINGATYYKDEIREVPDADAKVALQHGWAEDVNQDESKRLPTGERSITPKPVELKVKKLTARQKASRAEVRSHD